MGMEGSHKNLGCVILPAILHFWKFNVISVQSSLIVTTSKKQHEAVRLFLHATNSVMGELLDVRILVFET